MRGFGGKSKLNIMDNTFLISTKRGDEKTPVDRLEILMGDCKYRITKDIEGFMVINKVDLSEKWDHSMNISPRSGNEVTIH